MTGAPRPSVAPRSDHSRVATVASDLAASKASAAQTATASEDEQKAVAEVLAAEYGLLAAALGAAWSASLTRTSLFLFSLSASGVALGFAAQTGITAGPFRTFALVVLPIVLFIGCATFVRLVQVQREAFVYVIGLNRIRRFMADRVPAARPFLVLPIHDDQAAMYRSIGTGMSRRAPRFTPLYLAAQTQGMVGIVTGAVAAAFVGLLLAPSGESTAWLAAAASLLVVTAALFTYWQRSLAELYRSTPSRYPTPPEDLGAPF